MESIHGQHVPFPPSHPLDVDCAKSFDIRSKRLVMKFTSCGKMLQYKPKYAIKPIKVFINFGLNFKHVRVTQEAGLDYVVSETFLEKHHWFGILAPISTEPFI